MSNQVKEFYNPKPVFGIHFRFYIISKVLIPPFLLRRKKWVFEIIGIQNGTYGQESQLGKNNLGKHNFSQGRSNVTEFIHSIRNHLEISGSSSNYALLVI